MEAVAGLPASRPTSQSFMMALSGLQYFWSHAKKSTLISSSSTRSPSWVSLEPPYFGCNSSSKDLPSSLSLLSWTHAVQFGFYSCQKKTTFASRFTTLDHLQALVPCCVETRLAFFTTSLMLLSSLRVGAWAILATNQYQSTSVTVGRKTKTVAHTYR